MERFLTAALILVASILFGSISADPASASGQSREDIVYSAKDWKALHKAYKTLGAQADGVVAGAFVDRVSTLLEQQWDRLPVLDRIVKKDKRFRRFVLRQLNEAVPADTAKRIKDNADKACAASASQLCQDISRRLAP